MQFSTSSPRSTDVFLTCCTLALFAVAGTWIVSSFPDYINAFSSLKSEFSSFLSGMLHFK